MRVEARRAPPIWHGTTEVEVRFRSVGDEGTDVELEHRGFESLGAAAAETRDQFGNGWPAVLASFQDHAA